ncbi:PAS domain S-box protein [Burkholderia sp. L27(2015)]|uniref:PAS domain S-box protein n=1 Tax=Burkholderia sp. L27(2015) TaxID=1641858 RepID=UPI00131D559B|nr:PAS domain S-box protein [Burkholderia sp. L27(2015)]
MLAIVLALLVNRWMELQFVEVRASLFLCAIAVSVWVGGTGAGILAIALSVSAFGCLFVSPERLFSAHFVDTPRLIIFSLTSLFIGALGIAKNDASRKLKKTHDQLVRTLHELEATNLALQVENTERKDVQDQLLRSEAFLAEGQKISQTGSWRWDSSQRKLTWSDEHYRIFGFELRSESPDLLRIAEQIHPDDRDEVLRIVRTAIREWARFECEYRIICSDGSLRYVQGMGRPLAQELNGSKEYIGTTVDITARRNAEEVLRKSEREFRTLAENLPDEVIRYDLNCRRIYINRAYKQSRGMSAAQILDTPLEANWAADISPEQFREILLNVMRTGTPNQTVGMWTTQQGTARYFSLHIVAERDTHGKITGALAIGRDITSLKEAQQSLEESRLLLRQLVGRSESVREEERKHLARELHDELGQCLLALRLQISMLNREYGAEDFSFQTKIRSMLELVDSTIKTIRNVMAELRPVELDMGILAALEWLVHEFATRTGVPCELRNEVVDIALCERSTTAIFRIAQEALRNVARHANAQKAAVDFRYDDGNYILEVRDNGKGFDPFEKKAKSFGLVGIRERVLMLDGKMNIATAPNEGTTVQVHIPIFAVPQF